MNGQGRIITFNYPNMVVRVHVPDLTPEEHEEQKKKIIKAAAEVLKEQIRGKYKHETHTD